jgi:hypothetical protein
MNIFTIKKTVNQHEKKKPQLFIIILQEKYKLDCFDGQKSIRFVEMYNKRFFQTKKEKILEIQKLRKESAV